MDPEHVFLRKLLVVFVILICVRVFACHAPSHCISYKLLCYYAYKVLGNIHILYS